MGSVHDPIIVKSIRGFLPRDAMQSAVMPRQVVRPSDRPSVCDVEVRIRCSHRLVYFENYFRSPESGLWLSLSADANIISLLQREQLEIVRGIGVGYDVRVTSTSLSGWG